MIPDKRMYKLSVVIPAYNVAGYVQQAIHSVHAQTRHADEVVVVNDGSTDETATLLANLPGIKVVTQSNHGLSAARNAGTRAATGDFIVLLDADDYWHPQHLEVISRVLIYRPEAKWISTCWTPFNSPNPTMPLPITMQKVIRYDYPLYAAYRNRLLPSATAVARDTLVAIGGFPDDVRRSGEDKICWANLAAAGHHLYFVEAATCFYRLRPTSISSTEAASTERLSTLFDRHSRVQHAILAGTSTASTLAFLRGMALRTLLPVPDYTGSAEALRIWDQKWGPYAGLIGKLFRRAISMQRPITRLSQFTLKAYLRLAGIWTARRARVCQFVFQEDR